LPTRQAQSTARSIELAWLAAILVIAFALRVVHITWGVPDYVFPDAFLHIIGPAAAIVADGDFTLSQSQFVHPPVLVYALGAVYWSWSLLSGQPVFASGLEFQEQLPTLILLGRGLGLFVALASIAVQFRLARRLLGSRVALFAAAGFALAPLHVLESHRIHPDGLMLLLILLASDWAVAARERSSPRLLLLAFATAGLAGATKYVGVFGGAVPAWVAFTWYGADRWRGVRLAAAGSVASLAGFSLGMAPALFHFDRVVFVLGLFAQVGFVSGAPGYGLTGNSWANVRFLYALFVALPFSLGWPLYVAGLVGLPLLQRRAREASGVVLAFLIPYFLMQGGAALVVARYFAPLVPFLAISAGLAFERLAARRGALGAVLVALVLGYTLTLSASQVARMDQGPQRRAIASIAELARSAADSGRTPVLGYWGRWAFVYDTLRPSLEKLDLEIVQIPAAYQGEIPAQDLPQTEAAWLEYDLRWIEEFDVKLIVLASWAEYHFSRVGPEPPETRFYQRLSDGRLGFRLADHFESSFLSQPLYVWGDPMLQGHWETGIVGYNIFVRDDVLR
jgi:4-amino-4-deoxy-L-arabinose transferase-like glycosyltransferase